MTRYSATSPLLAPLQTALHDREINARLARARIGDQVIVEVFPQFTISFEIDHHRDLLALLVRDEVNAFHASTPLLE